MVDSKRQESERSSEPAETSAGDGSYSAKEQLLRSSQMIGGLSGSVESVAKAVVAVLGAVTASVFLFYVFGFVIVNLHLLSVGARDFQLAKPSYVPAGVAFFLVLASSFASIFLLYAFFASGITKPLARVGLGVLCTLLGISLAFVLLLVAYEEPLTESLTEACSSPLTTEFLGERLFHCRRLFLLLGLQAALLLGLLIGRSSGTDVLPARSEAAILLSVPFLGLFLLVSWGRDIYPTLQPALGGGRPPMVRLVVPEAEDREGLEAVGLEFEDRVSRPVGLLDEAQDSLLLMLLDDRHYDSLRVPAGAVRFIQHLSQRTRLKRKLVAHLEDRFGDVPPETLERIRGLVTPSDICRVHDRASSADSLDEVNFRSSADATGPSVRQ